MATTQEPQTTAKALALTPGDLIAVTGTARVLDLTIAKALGFSRPRTIRTLISRNAEELQDFGPLPRLAAKGAGRTAQAYLLTEQQAILIATLSGTTQARAVRRALITVFTEWRARQPSEPRLTAAEKQRQNRIRFYKIQFASAAAALDELGVDVEQIPLKIALEYGRILSGAPQIQSAR